LLKRAIDGEVGAASLAKELLRELYPPTPSTPVAASLCSATTARPVPSPSSNDSLAPSPAGRRRSRAGTRTSFTNVATEDTNLVVKNIKRLGFGFRNFENCRLRLLLR
jgi:Transposase